MSFKIIKSLQNLMILKSTLTDQAFLANKIIEKLQQDYIIIIVAGNHYHQQSLTELIRSED